MLTQFLQSPVNQTRPFVNPLATRRTHRSPSSPVGPTQRPVDDDVVPHRNDDYEIDNYSEDPEESEYDDHIGDTSEESGNEGNVPKTPQQGWLPTSTEWARHMQESTAMFNMVSNMYRDLQVLKQSDSRVTKLQNEMDELFHYLKIGSNQNVALTMKDEFKVGKVISVFISLSAQH